MWGVLRWRPGRLLLLLAGPALVAGLCVLLTWLVPLRPLLAGGTAAPAPADLAPKYRAFLEEVAPLISERERQVFLSLTRDYQRDDFIQRFWEVRDPYPETPRNELRDAWEERLKAAQERSGTVVEDRARGPARTGGAGAAEAGRRVAVEVRRRLHRPAAGRPAAAGRARDLLSRPRGQPHRGAGAAAGAARRGGAAAPAGPFLLQLHDR